jgi:hypothetical protein
MIILMIFMMLIFNMMIEMIFPMNLPPTTRRWTNYHHRLVTVHSELELILNQIPSISPRSIVGSWKFTPKSITFSDKIFGLLDRNLDVTKVKLYLFFCSITRGARNRWFWPNWQCYSSTLWRTILCVFEQFAKRTLTMMTIVQSHECKYVSHKFMIAEKMPRVTALVDFLDLFHSVWHHVVTFIRTSM